jgi:hypothetical protein
MLQQHDRVCEIDLECASFHLRASEATRIVSEPFPLLECLVLKSGQYFASTDTLLGGSAPRLHTLHLDVSGQRYNLNTFQFPTRMGEGGGRNSTLDLAWCNMAALIQGTFVGADVDFGGSQVSWTHSFIRISELTSLSLDMIRWLVT